MDIVDWTLPGLQITSFSMRSKNSDTYDIKCTGITHDQEHVRVNLPFRTLPHNGFVEAIRVYSDIAGYPDLAERLLTQRVYYPTTAVSKARSSSKEIRHD